MVLAAANTYLGLFAGLTIASAIPAAVVSMAVLRLLGGGHILENNIVQTGASAGASIAAGVIFTLPALVILGYWKDFNYWWVLAIAGLGGLLGVLFSVPLRRSLIVEQQLAFPEGKAAAEVLKAGENPGPRREDPRRSRALVGGVRRSCSRPSGLRLMPDSALARGFIGKALALHRHEPVAGAARRRLHRRAEHRRSWSSPAACCRGTSRSRSITRISCDNPALAAQRRGLPSRGCAARRDLVRADSLSRRRRDAGRRLVDAVLAAQVASVSGIQQRSRRDARRRGARDRAHRARPADEVRC